MWDACKLLWSLLIGLFRSRASLEAENLALRQQVIVLRRTAPKRLRFNVFDRLIFVGPPSTVPGPSRCTGGRQTGDHHSLAPCWVQNVLALEIKVSPRKTDGAV